MNTNMYKRRALIYTVLPWTKVIIQEYLTTESHDWPITIKYSRDLHNKWILCPQDYIIKQLLPFPFLLKEVELRDFQPWMQISLHECESIASIVSTAGCVMEIIKYIVHLKAISMHYMTENEHKSNSPQQTPQRAWESLHTDAGGITYDTG